MILVLERDHLLAALSRVAGIIDSRQTIPILANVLLTAENDRLTIRATNLDMEAVESIACHVGEPGTTTVPASKLSELARSLSEGAQIAMKLGDRLQITSGRTKINLGFIPPVAFPQIWEEEWPVSFEIEASELSRLLARVSYAQSDNAARAYIQGVNFDTVDGKLRLAATDTHVVAIANGSDQDGLASYTVPTKMISEMARLAASFAGQVTLGFSETKCTITAGATSVTSKLIDRSLKFPQCERVIPSNCPNRAVLDIPETIGAIKRAMIASQGMKDNTVKLTFKTGIVQITARNSEADALDEIDAEYEGDEVTVALSPHYLLEILGAIPTENVEVEFSDSKGNMIWRSPGDLAALVVTAPQLV